MTEPAQGDEDEDASRLRPWRRRGLVAGGVMLTLVVVFHLAGGWYFASVLEERALSGEDRRASLKPDYDVDVLEVFAERITLDAADDDRVEREGTFGLAWEGGRGLITGVLGREGDRVTREFRATTGSPPAIGERSEIDSRVETEETFPLALTDGSYTGKLGEYPAWFVPGESETWFIFVHGNGMTRRDGLRMLPAAVEAGLPSLLITYRNDEGAPEADDGRLTYGKDEWRDLEAAVQYALDQGAESVVLMGVSMGGAVVTAFLLESPLASRVSGVILDSPMLDFKETVEFQAEDETLPLTGLPLPGTLVTAAERFTAQRFGVDWNFTDYLERSDELDQPILLFHGTDDETVPPATSEDLAERRPDLVREFVVVEGAGHVESWNADPDAYRAHMLAFFESLGID